jgi:chromate reductase
VAGGRSLSASWRAAFFLNGFVMNRPEVMIPQAHNKFDADGKLTAQATRDFISAHLTALKTWVSRLKYVASAA